jgi:hypothetical protein
MKILDAWDAVSVACYRSVNIEKRTAITRIGWWVGEAGRRSSLVRKLQVAYMAAPLPPSAARGLLL